MKNPLDIIVSDLGGNTKASSVLNVGPQTLYNLHWGIQAALPERLIAALDEMGLDSAEIANRYIAWREEFRQQAMQQAKDSVGERTLV